MTSRWRRILGLGSAGIGASLMLALVAGRDGPTVAVRSVDPGNEGGFVEAAGEDPRWVVAGPPRVAVLAPRHRITSPVPTLVVVVPGDEGEAEITVGLQGGGGGRVRTRERVVAWPRRFGTIGVGERGWVVLRIGDRVARSGFVRVATVEADPEREGLGFAESGLPAEALRIVAHGAFRDGRWPTYLLVRSGLPRLR